MIYRWFFQSNQLVMWYIRIESNFMLACCVCVASIPFTYKSHKIIMITKKKNIVKNFQPREREEYKNIASIKFTAESIKFTMGRIMCPKKKREREKKINTKFIKQAAHICKTSYALIFTLGLNFSYLSREREKTKRTWLEGE